MTSGLLLYALLWVSFGVVHSVLTLPGVRTRLSAVFGARFEERKLVSIYGEAYRRYQSSVSAFIPAFVPAFEATWRSRHH